MTTNDIEAALKKAATALDTSDFNVAAPLYQSVLDADPENHEACLMLGSVFGETGRLPEAVELLRKAITLNLGDVSAGLVLAHLFHAMGEPSNAIRVLEELGQTVEDAEVTYTLAVLEEEAGNRGHAHRLLERAIEQDSTSVGAWLALAAFRMNAGEFSEAEAAYTEVLKIDPANANAIGFLSVVLSELARPDEAENLLREALRSNDQNSELHYYLAHTLKQAGQHADALVSCDQALALSQNDRRFLLKKVDILEGKGDLEQAFELLRPVLESGDIPLEAALIFSRLSFPLGMVDHSKLILGKMAEQTLMPLHQRQVDDALTWLDSIRYD